MFVSQNFKRKETTFSVGSLQVKEFINVIFENVPTPFLKNSIIELNASDLNQLIALHVTVTRVGQKKCIEEMKLFECKSCKMRLPVSSDLTNFNEIIPPQRCSNFVAKKKSNLGQNTKERCGNSKFEEISLESSQIWIDYQEITVQESFKNSQGRRVPSLMTVILKV